MMYENIDTIDVTGMNVAEYAMLVELAYDEWLSERYSNYEPFLMTDEHW